MKRSVAQLIGNTPLLKLSTCCNSNNALFAKLEGQNVGGSVKDRVALALLNDMENKNLINEKSVIFEPSSGNTGIGLAMIGATRGLTVKIMLPENATKERISLLKILGAQIQFCSKEDWTGEKPIKKCKEIVKKYKNFVMPNQYENPVCVEIHRKTTGKEILKQCPSITHLVATIGTGGTITGVAKCLKKHNPQIQIIGVEIGPNSTIPGPRSIQNYIPPIIDFDYIDRRVMIEDEKAVFKLHRTLTKTEGLFCGVSSAAALWAAREISFEPTPKEKNIVCIFPDRGEKYLSTLS